MTAIAAPLVLYHADCDDGFGAAYAAWRSLGDDADYQPVYYGDVVAPELLAGRQVFVLDFSFPPKVIRDMAQHATQITMLDHHKSAAAEWAQAGPIPRVEVVLDMQRSGAQIAWDYFHPRAARPALVDHIGDRDLWRFALPDTRAVCAGLSLQPTTFAAWNEVADQPAGLLERGRVVLEVLQGQIDRAVRKDLRPVSLCGHRGLAANVISNTSEVGQIIARKSGTFSLTFFIKGDLVICSLRSLPPFDVSLIAAHYGGGGHAQASGFTLPIDQFFTEIWRN
jgi:oligoribonuclease NrnB/cAMP/cGMP phosphodiesterase (DHH superfamily)